MESLLMFWGWNGKKWELLSQTILRKKRFPNKGDFFWKQKRYKT